MKHTTWISWDDATPEEYQFDSLAELNAFLRGISEAADRTEQQYEQFDTLEEYEDKYQHGRDKEEE